MQQPTSNRFQKGLNSDLSLTDRPQDMYLDGHNIRIARREGGTLWAANIKGNEETFQLSKDYIPLGSTEYDGFLFIASTNPDKGYCEIGCYPSYDQSGVLTRDYRPLQNFSPIDISIDVDEDCLVTDIDKLGPLNSNSLNFDCKYPIRMIARSDFDGSVNLYFTDNLNPWRVVNSGFILTTGEKNSRYITENQINGGFINGINENENIPIVDLLSTDEGGALKVGNYFFFVRYTDLNFSSTSFLGQSGPIPIFNSVTTGVEITFGGEADGITGKKVKLNISNLNTSANFVELGFLRYYERDIFEAKIINKRYSITGSSIIIDISGNETFIDSTIEEIVNFKPSDALICKDLEQIDNQLYLANTRGPQLDHPDLRRFMCALTLSEGYTNNGPAPEIRVDINENPYSSNANDTEEKVGYFSGETYAFACVPYFKGGFSGFPYPVTGYDNYNGLSAAENKDGIYRFAKVHDRPYWDGTDTFIKSIKVDTTAAQAIYNSSVFLKENLIGVVVCRAERNKNLLYQGLSLRCYNGKMNPKLGFKLDENDRVLTDGNDFFSFDDNIGVEGGDVLESESLSFMPMFEPASYSLLSKVEIVSNIGPQYANFSYFFYAPPYRLNQREDFVEKNKLGIFSTDYYLDRTSVPDSAHIQMVGRTSYGQHWKRESTITNNVKYVDTNALQGYTGQLNGTTPIYEFDPALDCLIQGFIAAGDKGHAPTFIGYNQKDIIYDDQNFNSAVKNITGWDGVPNSGFTARFDEGREGDQNSMYYLRRELQISNYSEYDISLACATPDYIGIELAPAYNPNINQTSGVYVHYSDEWDRAIVNVCRTDPASLDYTDFYDFKNEAFYPIGNFQTIDDFLTQPVHEYFRGDCFVQRGYIKIMNASAEAIGPEFNNIITGDVPGWTLFQSQGNYQEAPEAFLRGFGHWVSVVTENAYNVNYRHELGRNLFYPKSNVIRPGKSFAWIFDSPESFFYNGGYTNLLGPRSRIGIDLLQPTTTNKYPTRIRPSATHIFGSIIDGYRQFILTDAKDFDYTFGEINVLRANLDILYSFQSRAINVHPVNERATQQADSGSTVILGESTGLTQFKTVVTDRYGCQHRFAVVKANAGLYCIDWNKRSMLRIAGNNLQVLDIEKGAQTWLRDIIGNESSGYSDVLELLPDQHPCGKGIHGGYNVKYKEVLFTFRFSDESYTIAYSEVMDAFLGTHGYKPIHYAHVEEDLYSFVDNKGWLHDVNEEHDTYYGELDEWRVRYVVNEQANIANHWDSMIISSNNRRFKSVSFETQHQTALQDPFVNEAEFWYKPTYRENSWRLPIRRADNTKEPEENIYDDFTADKTPLRGRYLVVELIYNENKDLWVREVITSKTQSNA